MCNGRARQAVPALLTMLAILVVWQITVEWRNTPRWLLPSPLDIAIAMIDSAGLLRVHIGITLLEMGLGFSIALTLGVLVAVAGHLSGSVRRSVSPLLVVSQSVPVIVLAPLLVIWFGFGIAPKVALVVLVCFFPICVSFLDGLQAADRLRTALLRLGSRTTLPCVSIVVAGLPQADWFRLP